MMQATNGVIYGAGSNGVSNTLATNAFPALSLNNVIIANSTSKALAMTNTANNLYRTRLSNVYQYNNGTASTGDYWGTLNTLSANPFVNASSGNFALSPTSAAFATLGGVGFTYPSANTVDYSDIGGAQHAGPTVPAASTVLSPTAFGYSQTGTLALAAAADVLSGINRGDGTLGTLNASNLNTALGNGQPDATAGIIENGKIIGNITGTYAPSVSGGGASGFGLLPN
jgi:hypothetical protein